MISRVADHCFWFGRYLERAESTARVLAVTRNLALDAELPPAQVWMPVLIVAGEAPRFVERFGQEAAADGEIVQRYLTWDDDDMTSILRSVGAARENARSIRDVVSIEAWETVNELYLWLGSEAAQSEWRGQRYDLYRHIRQSTQLCLGLLRSTMLHDTPLDFIWLGVLLERVGQTARMLDVHHHALTHLPNRHQVVDTAVWLSLLRACSGFEPFMKTNRGRVAGPAVAAFLLLEPKFPRSVRYCISAAYERLAAIRPPADHHLPGGQTLERLRVLEGWVRERRRDTLDPAGIHEMLTHVVDETAAICDGLGRELFGDPPPTDEGAAAQ
jgi:uncharacterized alpha-E superfamily protein